MWLLNHPSCMSMVSYTKIWSDCKSEQVILATAHIMTQLFIVLFCLAHWITTSCKYYLFGSWIIYVAQVFSALTYFLPLVVLHDHLKWIISGFLTMKGWFFSYNYVLSTCLGDRPWPIITIFVESMGWLCILIEVQCSQMNNFNILYIKWADKYFYLFQTSH